MNSASWSSWQAAQEAHGPDDIDERPLPSFVAFHVSWMQPVTLEDGRTFEARCFRSFVLGTWQWRHALAWREAMAKRYEMAWWEEEFA